jgi:flagellin
MKVDTEVTAGTPDTKTGKTTFSFTKKIVDVVKDLSFDLHVGADADMTNKITVNVSSMTAKGLGISGLNVADDSGIAATYAIDAIADAISTVSAQRSALGAVQNRLEHTINNLDNVVENTTSRTTFFPRQVSPCSHRRTSPTRAFFPCSANRSCSITQFREIMHAA